MCIASGRYCDTTHAYSNSNSEVSIAISVYDGEKIT